MPNEPESALDITPQMMLDRAREWLDQAQPEPTKAITIFLNDEDHNYGTMWFNSGCSLTQIIALMEVVKFRMMANNEGVLFKRDLQ